MEAGPPAVNGLGEEGARELEGGGNRGGDEEARPLPTGLTHQAPPPPPAPSPKDRRDKQVFVLSSAGKPIFSRHGDEQQLAQLMGVIQAIISISQEEAGSDDFIRCITTARRRWVVAA